MFSKNYEVLGACSFLFGKEMPNGICYKIYKSKILTTAEKFTATVKSAKYFLRMSARLVNTRMSGSAELVYRFDGEYEAIDSRDGLMLDYYTCVRYANGKVIPLQILVSPLETEFLFGKVQGFISKIMPLSVDEKKLIADYNDAFVMEYIDKSFKQKRR